MRFSTSCSLILAALTAFPATSALAATPTAGDPVPGRYVVTLDLAAIGELDRRQVAAQALDIAEDYDATVVHLYGTALAGFAAAMSAPQARALAADWRIAGVEQDRVVTATAPTFDAPRELDRGDRPSGTVALAATGAGIHAYVIDTGLRRSDRELAGRVGNGYSAVLDVAGTYDCHGHGTRVADLAFGATRGVARGVTLHPVRVVGCDGLGLTSDLIAGVDWVSAHRQQPAIATVRLGAGSSPALAQAIRNATAAGVLFVD